MWRPSHCRCSRCDRGTATNVAALVLLLPHGDPRRARQRATLVAISIFIFVEADVILVHVRECLRERFGIDHVTIQIESQPCTEGVAHV